MNLSHRVSYIVYSGRPCSGRVVGVFWNSDRWPLLIGFLQNSICRIRAEKFDRVRSMRHRIQIEAQFIKIVAAHIDSGKFVTEIASCDARWSRTKNELDTVSLRR